jgi:hypothetical protein
VRILKSVRGISSEEVQVERFEIQTLRVELSEPEETRLRDFANLLDTLNSLYNYTAVLTEPAIGTDVEARLRETQRKEPTEILYSSSLERILGAEGRVNVISIERRSPMVITLAGIATVITALAALLGAATPLFKMIRAWRQAGNEEEKKKLEEQIMRLDLKSKEMEFWRQQMDLLERLEKMNIAEEYKDYIRNAVLRTLTGLERNPIKPILAAA